MRASNSVEEEGDHPNGNNHAKYEENMVTGTAAAGVTDNPSTPVVNTTENEKNNKAEVAFLFAIVDKMTQFSGVIIAGISGILYSHDHTSLQRFSNAWIQALYAGGAIQTFFCILLAGPASFFKEIGSPDHPLFVVCSLIGFLLMIFWLVLICGILFDFEHISKCVIWFIGVLLLLSMVLVWVAFQRQPMKVWLKWTKNALEGLSGITFRYYSSLRSVLAKFAQKCKKTRLYRAASGNLATNPVALFPPLSSLAVSTLVLLSLLMVQHSACFTN